MILTFFGCVNRSTRDAVGLELEGNVVLIDEAHNLLSSIEAIHSNAVSGSLLERAHAQLHTYHAKYKSRLHPKNLRSVTLFSMSILSMVSTSQCWLHCLWMDNTLRHSAESLCWICVVSIRVVVSRFWTHGVQRLQIRAADT